MTRQKTMNRLDDDRRQSPPSAAKPHSRDASANKWSDLEDLAGDYTPEVWVRLREAAEKAGHGGGDLLELIEFVDGITGKAPDR